MRRMSVLAFGLALVAAGCATETYEGTEEPAYQEPAYEQPGEAAPADDAMEDVLGTPFEEVYDPACVQPEVTIINNTDQPLTVSMWGEAFQNVEVAPWGNQTIATRSGTYSFTATAPGVESTSGTDDFRSSYRYTWTFTIVEEPR